MLRCCQMRSAGASSAPRRAPVAATYRCRKLVARVACHSGPEARQQYRAEFSMLSNRLGGTVSNAIEAALHDRATIPFGTPAPPPSASPAELAAHLLRCVDKQLQTRKYSSGGDEAGDVLGSFPSNTLLYYQGEGLQHNIAPTFELGAVYGVPTGPQGCTECKLYYVDQEMEDGPNVVPNTQPPRCSLPPLLN